MKKVPVGFWSRGIAAPAAIRPAFTPGRPSIQGASYLKAKKGAADFRSALTTR
jgi:hypothetical protein